MLKGKNILITGASGGIGAEIAKTLAKAGATVVINYNKNSAGANKTLSAIKKMSPGSIAVKADVSDRSEVDRMMKRALKSLKKLDVVVNNASAPLSFKAFPDTSWKDLERHIDVTLAGAFNVISAALPHMLRLNKGKIINILSSVTMGLPPARNSGYVTAKYALLGLSRAMAADLGPSGITVNCVSPGMTETDMISALPGKLKELVAYQTPLKRLAKPPDIAGCVAFLSSDASDYITGANIPVCGGGTM